MSICTPDKPPKKLRVTSEPSPNQPEVIPHFTSHSKTLHFKEVRLDFIVDTDVDPPSQKKKTESQCYINSMGERQPRKSA